MRLASGTRLGPYEIVALIGAGGMGEVYKARDTRLDRTVAIKVLPADVAADPERRRRFEQEARAVSALNHPHICTLYDIGESIPASPESRAPSPEPFHYLVMEHLEGQTLAERLQPRKGGTQASRLRVEDALEIGAQIADALSAAHKHGIVHRDLKPANIMLTKSDATGSGALQAKLLDFGVSRLTQLQGGTGASETRSGTSGHIVGTVPYMAPEQIEGREVDARTDLFALGAVLYEMVTGKRAFEGSSPASVMAAVLEHDPPPISRTQPLTPPALDRLVRKCLAKDPDGRWDSAHDVADELRWMRETRAVGALTGVQPRRRLGLRTSLMVAGVLVATLTGAGAMWLLRSPAPRASLARLSLDVRPAESLNAGGFGSPVEFLPTPGGSRTALTWTPDGQSLVFVGRRDGVQQLYVRRLDAAEARPLGGTEGAQVPAVSPDGQWVAFWAHGAIRKVPLGGGPVTDLASGPAGPPYGLVWDARGRMFYGRPVGGADLRIWQIPPGGEPTAVTSVREAGGYHVLPCVLPGERVLLYTVLNRESTWGDEKIVAETLGSGERKVLLKDAADARYVSTGHLVFLRRGQLFAVPFDAERVEVRGPEVAVLDAVAQAVTAEEVGDLTGAGQFAVSATGTLAWLPGAVVPYPDTTLVTVDRRGQVSPLPAPVRNYRGELRLSPDGRRLVVTSHSLAEAGLWLYDLGRGTVTPLSASGESFNPVWSPDGRSLVFSWFKDGRWSLASQPVDEAAAPQVLLPGQVEPSSWTRDGRQLAAYRADDNTTVMVTVENGTASVQPAFQTPHNERWPEISPDGRWLAYASNVSGRDEVYVRPYPGPGRAEPASIEGGLSPAWHPNGRELFYLSSKGSAGRRRMMVVEFAAGSPPRMGRPLPLFEYDHLALLCAFVRCFDVAPDGQRFYTVQTPTPPAPPVVTHISLIQNWFDELRAKVPTRR